MFIVFSSWFVDPICNPSAIAPIIVVAKTTTMKVWDNFLTALNKYVDFNGRSRRTEFWSFVLVSFLFGVAANRWDEFMFGGRETVESLVDIALFLPSIAVGARRLHDTGRSGWWQLIALTGIGLIVLFIWWAQDGDHRDNKWGRNPKLAEDELDWETGETTDVHDDQIV